MANNNEKQTTVNSIIKHRRGHIDKWRRSIVVPEDGELIIVEFDDGSRKCKVGDGVNRFSALKYVDDATRTELLNKFNEFEQSTEIRLDNAEKRYTAKLGLAKEEMAQQVMLAEASASSVSEAVSALDSKLTKQLSELDQQKADTSVTDALATQVGQINADITDIRNDGVELVNLVYSIENTLETDFDDLNTETDAKLKAFGSDLNRLDEQIQSNTVAIDLVGEDTAAQLASFGQELTDRAAELSDQLETASARLEHAEQMLATQSKRMDAFVALPDGSTLADSELTDIRLGYDGITHSSAGNAVRQIGYELDELRESLPSYIPANAVDGLLYEGSQLYLTSNGVPVGNPVEIVGGGYGTGSASKVKVQDNLGHTTFTIADGNRVYIDFTYTSFEDGLATGDGACTVTINGNAIESLTGRVQHGVSKPIDVTDYLTSNKTNKIEVTCSDKYGVRGMLIYNITLVELRVELDPAFIKTNTGTYSDEIVVPYTVYGKVDKTLTMSVDNSTLVSKKLLASVHNKAMSDTIPKQSHGVHTVKIELSATLENGDTIYSKPVYFELVCVEEDNSTALLASSCEQTQVTQGDLVTIPILVYDPAKSGIERDTEVRYTIYSEVNGELEEYDTNTLLLVSGELYEWKTKNYPNHTVVFEISYTYDKNGEIVTLPPNQHRVSVIPATLNVEPETGGLQLYLSASGHRNEDTNHAEWSFGNITTTFDNFNWHSNGWFYDESTDETCLRLNGDARAVINFAPFATDAKALGKTIEFDFLVRDVNSRDAVVIDCMDNGVGFRATPDTAYLQSTGTLISCRYKDKERVHVTITVEPNSTSTRFVSIYLDGVLSGVQSYSEGDTESFTQINRQYITIGSPDCGIDIYSVRIYNRALTTQQVLKNYIADAATMSAKQQLVKENYYGEPDEFGSISDYIVTYDQAIALGNIPVVLFTGTMPTHKGDKKENSVYFKFTDPTNTNPTADDICYYAEDNGGKGLLISSLDVQGTSSAGYARKNWKVKFAKKLRHIKDAITTKTFCLKVDYAEATGTHNTGTANYVETLYDKSVILDEKPGVIKEYTGEGWLIPQKKDPRIRTTIQGFPCLIFERPDENTEPVFSAKANFNYDKGSKEAFGFTSEFDDTLGPESWEFCNNTSEACNFLAELPADWRDDFEPRYTSKTTEITTNKGKETVNAWDRIEELIEKDEAQDSSLTETERAELVRLQGATISDFKEMHDWVVSTATMEAIWGKDENGDDVVIGSQDIDFSTAEDFEAPVIIGDETFTKDSREYRLAKFKSEFTSYFNKHYSLIYYVFTFFALMVDQRAKNMFLTRWKDEDGTYKWYPYFYDNDTIFGINNVGALVFDYYHEDSGRFGTIGTMNVYNGQNSVLWNNFRECFASEIQDTYQDLRNNNKLDYDKLITTYVTEHSDKWSAAVYNEDAEYKYIVMARPHKNEAGDIVTDRTNLRQVRGPAEHHLRYFLDARLKYCDSKWFAKSYPDTNNIITLRLNPVQQLTPVPADKLTEEELSALNASSLNITPYSTMYVGVKFKSGTLRQELVAAGDTHSFRFSEYSNDTETYVYGANELSSIGSIAHYRCSYLNLSHANKLVELKIGHRASNYDNPNLAFIEVGNNNLLKLIDLRNCSGLGVKEEDRKVQKNLQLGGCPNIEHVYAEGTNLRSVSLPEAGHLKTLHLPNTTEAIVIKNQPVLTDSGFYVESYDNVSRLVIENCPVLNSKEILANCHYDQRGISVRLSGVTEDKWVFDDVSFIRGLFPVRNAAGELVSGIVDINDPTKDANISGTCYIKELTGAERKEIEEHYPNLKVKFGKMTSKVTFNYVDSNGETHVEEIEVSGVNSELGDVSDFIPEETPYWPANQAFTYECRGWSRREQVSKGLDDHEDDYLEYVEANALTDIAGDRILYPIFAAVRKKYPVTFVNPATRNGNVVCAVVDTPYGGTPEYPDNAPILVRSDVASPELYEFIGWDPSPENITGPFTCYAQFAILNSVWYTLVLSDISTYYDTDGNEHIGYVLNNSAKTMAITKCSNGTNSAVKIPDNFIVNGIPYTVVSVKGFNSHNKLELVSLPESVHTLADSAFQYCSNLSEITLHEGIMSIGASAFSDCSAIKEIHLPASLNYIGDAAFSPCKSLTSVTVADGNTVFAMVNDCLINTQTKALILGLSTGRIPQDGTVTSLRSRCFSGTNVVTVQIPNGVTTIPSYAFNSCDQLISVELPETVTVLDATCFAWCDNLTGIALPPALQEIKTYVFDSCPFETVRIPASVTKILENAFGNQKKLTTVTFEKKVDAKGNIVAPAIDLYAFRDSGADGGLVFNVPWSEDYVYPDHPDLDPAAVVGWGAKNFTVKYNYNYEEVD